MVYSSRRLVALWVPLLGVCVTVGLLALCCVGCSHSVKVPQADRLGSYSTQPYAEVLASVVKGEDGLVDYHAFQENPELRRKLEVYLDAVGRFGPDESPESFPTRHDELAYYINTYNAVMLNLWLKGGAATADAGAGVNKGWFLISYKIDGGKTYLHHLEQSVIRPRYAEKFPQLHFGLICGAVGCPPLLDEPYRGEDLEEQLDGVGRRWLSQEDGLRWDAKEKKVVMSKIFDWYRGDFDSMGGLKGVVEKYVSDDEPWKADAVEAAGAGRIEFMGYDWSINLAR